MNINFLVDTIIDTFQKLQIVDEQPVQKLLPSSHQESSTLLLVPELFSKICENCTIYSLGQLASCSKRARLFVAHAIATEPKRIGMICSNMLSDRRSLKIFHDFCHLSQAPTNGSLCLQIPATYDVDPRVVKRVQQTAQLFPNIVSLVFEKDSLMQETNAIYGLTSSSKKISCKEFARIRDARAKIIEACPNVRQLRIQKSTIDLSTLPERIKSVTFSECVAVPHERMMEIWRATKNCEEVYFFSIGNSPLSNLEEKLFSLPETDPWSNFIQLKKVDDKDVGKPQENCHLYIQKSQTRAA